MGIFPTSDLGFVWKNRSIKGVVYIEKWSHFFDLTPAKQFFNNLPKRQKAHFRATWKFLQAVAAIRMQNSPLGIIASSQQVAACSTYWCRDKGFFFDRAHLNIRKKTEKWEEWCVMRTAFISPSEIRSTTTKPAAHPIFFSLVRLAALWVAEI